MLLNGTPNPEELYPMFGISLYSLRKYAPAVLDSMEAGLEAEDVLRFIVTHGSITEFYNAVQYFTPTFTNTLLTALNEEKVEHLVKRTIASGRSIGTLPVAMRELGRGENSQELLKLLEKKVGSERFLGLILANGTLFELFMVLKASTPAFANTLLTALNEEKVLNWCERPSPRGVL